MEAIGNSTGCQLLPTSIKPAHAVVLTKLDTEIDDEPLFVYITMPQLAFKGTIFIILLFLTVMLVRSNLRYRVVGEDVDSQTAAQHFAQLDYATTSKTLLSSSMKTIFTLQFISILKYCVFLFCFVFAASLTAVVNGKQVSFTLDKTVFLSTAAKLNAK